MSEISVRPEFARWLHNGCPPNCRSNSMADKDDRMMGSLIVSGTGMNLCDSTQTVRSNRTSNTSGRQRIGSAKGSTCVVGDEATQSDLSSGIREVPSTSGSDQLSDYQVRHHHVVMITGTKSGGSSLRAIDDKGLLSICHAQVQQLIGRGKYSTVYAAKHLPTGTTVALKKASWGASCGQTTAMPRHACCHACT